MTTLPKERTTLSAIHKRLTFLSLGLWSLWGHSLTATPNAFVPRSSSALWSDPHVLSGQADSKHCASQGSMMDRESGAGVKKPVCREDESWGAPENQSVTHALVTLIKHALKADPSLLISTYRHIVRHLPDSSQEPYGQHIVRQFNLKPHLWQQLTKGATQRCLVVFLDPLCPHSSALFHHLLHLGGSILHNWNIRPFWWSPDPQKRHAYVTKALWILSIHRLIVPLCQALEQRGCSLHHLTPSLMRDVLESLGVNMMQFQEAMDNPMLDTIMNQVTNILKELDIKSFPVMICKAKSPQHTNPRAQSFRVFQGCPKTKDDVWRWLAQTEPPAFS